MKKTTAILLISLVLSCTNKVVYKQEFKHWQLYDLYYTNNLWSIHTIANSGFEQTKDVKTFIREMVTRDLIKRAVTYGTIDNSKRSVYSKIPRNELYKMLPPFGCTFDMNIKKIEYSYSNLRPFVVSSPNDSTKMINYSFYQVEIPFELKKDEWDTSQYLLYVPFYCGEDANISKDVIHYYYRHNNIKLPFKKVGKKMAFKKKFLVAVHDAKVYSYRIFDTDDNWSRLQYDLLYLSPEFYSFKESTRIFQYLLERQYGDNKKQMIYQYTYALIKGCYDRDFELSLSSFKNQSYTYNLYFPEERYRYYKVKVRVSHFEKGARYPEGVRVELIKVINK